MAIIAAFISDQRGFLTSDRPRQAGKWFAAFVILNEIRGVIVASSLAMQLWG